MTAKKRRDGDGSVYRRGDGRWVAQVRVQDPFTGQSRKVRRYASSRDDARKILKTLRENPPTSRSSSRDMTLASFLQSWVRDNLPRAEISASTKDIYSGTLKHYGIPAAGQIRLADFDPSQAEIWVSRVAATRKKAKPYKKSGSVQRSGDPIAASTVRNTFNAAVKALDVAVRDRLIADNPLRQIPRPRSPRPPVPVTKPAEVDRLLVEVTGMRIEAMVYLAAYTGMRIGEALSLRWDDVDLAGGTATIHRGTLDGVTTKTEKVRTLTLIPEVVSHLKAWRRQQNQERLLMGEGWQDSRGLVFTTATGAPVRRDNASRDLRRGLRRAGVSTARPWHSLRHGLAHRLLQKGVPLVVVSAILGHSGIQITADTYGHIDAAVPVAVLVEALGR